MTEFVNMWKNYANFNDRTTVRGYWMPVLINFLIGIVLSVLIYFIGFLSIVSILYSLAAFIPGLAISIRRLRDAGKSPLNLLWVFVPLVGAIILIILCCKASVPDDGVPVV